MNVRMPLFRCFVDLASPGDPENREKSMKFSVGRLLCSRPVFFVVLLPIFAIFVFFAILPDAFSVRFCSRVETPKNSFGEEV